MQEPRSINAIILAGDRKASIQVKDDNKAFLTLKGTPLFIHIAQALQQSRFVRNVFIIGPADRLTETLKAHEGKLGNDLHILEQTDNMMGNFKAGYTASIGVPQHTSFSSLRNGEHDDTPILVVPTDIPLLTPWEIDEFIENSDLDEYDYTIGITSHTVLSHYYPTDDRPGIRMHYFHLKEDLFRQNNLHLAKPLRLRQLDHIEKMYELRYQVDRLNALRMVFLLIRVSISFLSAVPVFILLQLSLYFTRHNHLKCADLFRKLVRTRTLQRGVGKILGARTKLVYTRFGGATLDIDHDEMFDAMNIMYDEWMGHQREKVKFEVPSDEGNV